MAKKKQILKRNFYFKADGSSEFRKMIRGDLITGRTGMTDPHKVNKQADDIRHKFIADYYKLEKEKVKQNVINEFYYMKERKMALLKKKLNYPSKIANQLIMINSKCILLKRIN